MNRPFFYGMVFGLVFVCIGALIMWFPSTKLLIHPSSPSLLSLRPTVTTTPTIMLQTPASQKILSNEYHIFQTFNNCGPAAMSMALSYYGIKESQEKLGLDLRPYQVPGGDNDDKSVTLSELSEKSKSYGFTPYLRPNGSMEQVELFITYDIPVITRTWTKVNEDIGHYRIIKGYDKTTGEIIQDDSLQGKNLRYSYNEFKELWEKFGYEYLVLIPKDKIEIAKAIIGEDVDEKLAWKKAVGFAKEQVNQNPENIYKRFNLSVAHYHIGDYQASVDEFEKVESRLPFRTLWYQIEPIQAYYKLEKYDRVFQITDRVLGYYNRAFSELYIVRGEIYKKQGNIELAKSEFEKAVFYNVNLKSAQTALASVQ